MAVYRGIIRRAAAVPTQGEDEYVILWDTYQIVVPCKGFVPKEGALIEFEPEYVDTETPRGGFIPPADRLQVRTAVPIFVGGVEVERQQPSPGGYRRLGFKWLDIDGHHVITQESESQPVVELNTPS